MPARTPRAGSSAERRTSMAWLVGVAARTAAARARSERGRPAARPNCSATRSRPLTSSVTPCSTCRRVFTSRNQNRPPGSRRNSAVAALWRPAADATRTAIAWSSRRSGLGQAREPATPRRASGGGAGASSPAHPGRRRSRPGRPGAGPRCGGPAGPRARGRRCRPRRPRPPRPSRRRARRAGPGPLDAAHPPPPAAGGRLDEEREADPPRLAGDAPRPRSARSTRTGSSVPGTTGTPASVARRRAASLSPRAAIDRGSIAALGDKLAARRLAAETGVPVVPGDPRAGPRRPAGPRRGHRRGGGADRLPAPRQGGRRRGCAGSDGPRTCPPRLVRSAEAASAFGDGTVYLEHEDAGPPHRGPAWATGPGPSSPSVSGTAPSSAVAGSFVEESPLPVQPRPRHRELHAMAVRVGVGGRLHNAATVACAIRGVGSGSSR